MYDCVWCIVYRMMNAYRCVIYSVVRFFLSFVEAVFFGWMPAVLRRPNARSVEMVFDEGPFTVH